MSNQTPSELKALDRRWYQEVWNQGSKSGYDELAAPDLLVHSLPPGISPWDGLIMNRTGFPDVQFTIEDQIAEGDKVTSRLSVDWGTHSGDWVGIPPTGKQAKITGISIHRYEAGKVAEIWLELDIATMTQQLGLGPPEE